MSARCLAALPCCCSWPPQCSDRFPPCGPAIWSRLTPVLECLTEASALTNAQAPGGAYPKDGQCNWLFHTAGAGADGEVSTLIGSQCFGPMSAGGELLPVLCSQGWAPTLSPHPAFLLLFQMNSHHLPVLWPPA